MSCWVLSFHLAEQLCCSLLLVKFVIGSGKAY